MTESIHWRNFLESQRGSGDGYLDRGCIATLAYSATKRVTKINHLALDYSQICEISLSNCVPLRDHFDVLLQPPLLFLVRKGEPPPFGRGPTWLGTVAHTSREADLLGPA